MKASNSRPKLFQTGGYTPTQLSQSSFIPTYTGIPLAEAEKYGSSLAEMYHKNISDMTQLDILNANRQATAGDQGVSQELTAELQTQFEDIAKKGDYENMTSRINELARRYYNDPRRKAIDEQYKIAEEENKLVRSLSAQGKRPLFTTDWTKHQSVTLNPETGKYEPNIKQSDVQAQLEYDPRRQDIWKDVEPDSTYTTAQAQKDLQNIPGYLNMREIKSLSGGIDPKTGQPTGKIGQMVGYALDRYTSTPEYAQEKKLLTQENLAKGMNSSEAEQEADKNIQRKVLETGLMKTFTNVNPTLIRDWMLEKSMEGGGGDATRSLGYGTGHRFELPKDFGSLTTKFNPNDSGIKPDIAGAVGPLGLNPDFDPNKRYTPEELFKMREDRAKGVPNSERGTPAERKQYETVARAATAMFKPKVLESFDIKRAPADAEKEWLYSKDAYELVQQYQKTIEDELNHNVMWKYDIDSKSQTQQAAAQKWIQNNYTVQSWFDPEKGKVINPLSNPDFKLDPAGMKVIGETAGPNIFGAMAKDERFYNSYEVAYTDPKTNESQLFYVAKDPLQADAGIRESSKLRSKGVMNPFQIVNNNVGGIDAEYQDQIGKILLYKVNGKNAGAGEQPEEFNSYYEMLIYMDLLNKSQKK